MGSISIHVPRTGHDEERDIDVITEEIFQSTCPVRGTTPAVHGRWVTHYHFNPRAPYGARHGQNSK